MNCRRSLGKHRRTHRRELQLSRIEYSDRLDHQGGRLAKLDQRERHRTGVPGGVAVYFRQGMSFIHFQNRYRSWNYSRFSNRISSNSLRAASTGTKSVFSCIGRWLPFTMEGGLSGSTEGMIPRTVEQVFQVAEVMGKKGWEYKIEGEFLEIVSIALRSWDPVADWDRTV